MRKGRFPQMPGCRSQYRAVAKIDEIPSGMSVAISDVDGDYGAVVVSNANQHIPNSSTG